MKQKNKSNKKKLKAAFYNITGCAGCLLSVLFNEDDILAMSRLIDIVDFPLLKSKAKEKIRKVDFIFMEGLVATNDDLKTLKEARKKTRCLVALGACAHTGCVPAYRKFINKENYNKLQFKKIRDIIDINPSPISNFVKVDYTIPGCPPNKKEIFEFIKAISLEKRVYPYTKPVCIECRARKNICLLNENKLCLGPITVGGCNAPCPSGGFECWGCRGPTDDQNLKLMAEELVKKGYDKNLIRDRIFTFAGVVWDEVEKILKELD